MDLIHVGMPKAASTWLQEVFFPRHPELAVLGARNGDDDLYGAFLDQIRTLVQGSDLHTDVGAVAARLRELAEELGRRRGARILGISHEALCGEWPAGRNSGFLMDALAQAFPRAKVLLVLREPRAMVTSSHRQYVRMGGTATLERFLWDPVHCEGFADAGDPLRSHVVDFLLAAPRVEALRERFPAGVHVDCMERLQREPAAFAAGLCAFLGVREVELPERRTNVQLSDPALRLLRRLNGLFATRFHRRYGPMPLCALAAPWLRRRLPAGHSARDNPHLLRRLTGELIHRRFVEGPLAGIDRLLLRWLPRGNAFSLASLAEPWRAWLEERFRVDGEALRRLLPWDPAEYGYPVSRESRSGQSREPEPAGVGGERQNLL